MYKQVLQSKIEEANLILKNKQDFKELVNGIEKKANDELELLAKKLEIKDVENFKKAISHKISEFIFDDIQRIVDLGLDKDIEKQYNEYVEALNKIRSLHL